jgi:RNA polymerase sigma factor (sigma-70 family)
MPITLDTKKINSFFETNYAELRRIAARRAKNSPLTSPESLLAGAYEYLRKKRRDPVEDEGHLKNMLSGMFFHNLVDKLRRERKSQPFPDSLAQKANSLGPELDVRRCLDALRQEKSRAAEIVEHFYFAERTQVEIAHCLGISVRTVRLDLRTATAWIKNRLSQRPS